MTTTSLAILSTDINREHRLASEHATSAIQHARRAGGLLVEAKVNIGHGDWSEWVDEHFAGSARTARRYMRLAKRWPEIEAKRPDVADLSLAGAEAVLTNPRQVGDGFRPSFSDLKDPFTGRYVVEQIEEREALRAWLPTDGMKVIFYTTADATVAGIILPVAPYKAWDGSDVPAGEYYQVCRFVGHQKVEEGFVEGSRRGVRFDAVPRWLQLLGLPPAGDESWEWKASAAWGHAIHERVKSAPRDPRYAGGAS